MIKIFLTVLIFFELTYATTILDTLIHTTFETVEEQNGWDVSFPNDSIDDGAQLGISQFDTTDAYSGTTSLKATVLQKQDEDWYIQINFPTWKAKKNGIYRLSMRAKGENPVQVSVIYSENYSNPYQYKEGFTFNLHNNWEYYSGEFSSDVDGDSILQISLNIGKNIGDYYFDDITLELVDTIDQSNEWYNTSKQRIDSLRKVKAPTVFIDSLGNRLSGTVHFKEVNSEFTFGTTFDLTDTFPQNESDWYKNTTTKLFNSITIENDFKWVDYEPVKGQIDSAKIYEYCDFADSNNLNLRGHTLVWGLQEFGFNTHWSRQGTDEELVAAIKNRITRDVSLYKGKINEYDVWNEPFHEISLFTRCQHLYQDSSNIWELMDSAFFWAHNADSTVDLYLNEYSVVSGGQTETLYNLVKGMQERGVPIRGIGVQCHFEDNPIEPELIRKRLDRLGELGVKIRVTEFDLGNPETGVALTEAQMAKEYAKFYRTIFSHPAVSGLTIWGFWDKIIWNAPTDSTIGSGLYNSNMTPKMAADSIESLLTQEWHSDTIVTTDNVSAIRLFKGNYTVTLDNGAKLYSGTFKADSSESDTVVLFNTDGSSSIDKNKSKKSINKFSVTTDRYNRSVSVMGVQQGNEISFKLYNYRGQVVYQSTVYAGKECTSFDVSNVPNGTFILSVKGGSRALQQKLFLLR